MKRKHIARFHEEFRGARIPMFLGLNLAVRALPILGVLLFALGFGALLQGESNGAVLMAGTPLMVPVDQLAGEVKTSIQQIDSQVKEHREVTKKLDARLTDIEQKLTSNLDHTRAITDQLSKSTVLFGGDNGAGESIGRVVVDSPQFKSFIDGGMSRSGRIAVGTFMKTALVNADGQNQPLVPAHRVPGIVMPGQRRLTIRDLLPALPTVSNLIEFTKETLFTNAAAPQGDGSSPQVYENVAKAESALEFTLFSEKVQTLAHWIPASRQVLEDAAALASYINQRLTFGLKLKEEDQLLNGSGSGANLNGLITQSTAYDTSLDEAGDTKLDTLRKAIFQVSESEHAASAVVLNPSDWKDIELIKTEGDSIDSGMYIFGNPKQQSQPSVWGLPVVVTNSITAGEFLVGAFATAAAIWDRQQASVEISREHSDFFTKNMVAILCEERLALTVYNSDALIHGSFPG